jgi:NTE family protein
MRALVLGGGGQRGAYEVGVLQKVMRDEGRDYEIMAGVSVGALNVAYLSQARMGQAKASWESLHAMWKGIKGNGSIFKKWSMWPFSVIWKHSVYSTQPLRDLVFNNLDQNAVKESGREVRVGAVSWDTGKYYAADQNDPDFLKWVVASSAYPVVFEHMGINGQQWGDGGIRTVTPLGAAIKAGAEEIDVIMTSSGQAQRWDSKDKLAFARLPRLLDLIFDEIMENDLKVTGYKNELAELKEEYRKVKVRVMQPKAGTRMDEFSSTEFNPDHIEEMIQIGYKEAYQENF